MRSTLTRIVLVTLVIYALISFSAVRRELALMESVRDSTLCQLRQLRNENRDMEEKLKAELGDGEIMEQARKRLGLTVPGEIIFYFRESPDIH